MASLFSRNDSRALDQRRWLDLQRIFDLSQDLMCIIDAQGRFLRVNASARRILGYAPDELSGRRLIELVHPADVQRTLLAHDSVLRGAQVVEFENRVSRSDGSHVDLSWTGSWVDDGDESGVSYFIARDITNRRRAEVLREAQREVLQMIATGSALPEILRRICVIMETLDPSAKCAVTLFDAHASRAGAAISPSLPPRFLTIVQEALLGGSSASTWGATLRSGQTAICVDIEIDFEWQSLSDLAAEHGLRACWMTPVFGARGNFIATIGVFYSHHYEPTRRELVLVQTAASLVAVAVEHAREQAQLKESRQCHLTQLSSLADAARKLNSQLTGEELLQAIADIARDLVGAHVAVSALRSADGSTVELCKISHSVKYPSVVPSASLLDYARGAGEGTPQVMRTARSSNTAAMEIGIEWSSAGCITVPLVMPSGRQSGALCVADKRAGEFAHNDERVLAQLADLAAAGLENARLYTEVEARVRKRTQELQDSNRELEAFSYSVSHDLRGPLRAIAGFTGLLRDRHYETIDADGRRCIDRVLAGTQRMSNLIDDLLELGRVTRVEIRRRQVDLSEYARTILTRLREAAPERAAATVIEPQVWVEGDPGLLEIALENLLDNAWKFTAGRPVAEIRFGTLREPGRNDGERTLFVQDNGVGFDPRYAANLFGVFQRLHAAGEFPGTGVGLATVQRIVQRHGGRIWAEAGVDRGATIYFTIAKGQQ